MTFMVVPALSVTVPLAESFEYVGTPSAPLLSLMPRTPVALWVKSLTLEVSVECRLIVPLFRTVAELTCKSPLMIPDEVFSSIPVPKLVEIAIGAVIVPLFVI